MREFFSIIISRIPEMVAVAMVVIMVLSVGYYLRVTIPNTPKVNTVRVQ